MKKSIVLLVSLALTSTMIIGCSSSSVSSTAKESTTEVTTTENTVESVKAEHYAKAEELSNAGKYEEAIDEYKKAEDYSDSKDKIYIIYHSQGEKALSAEKFEEAIELYKKAGEYKDTTDEINGIYYVRGEKAFSAGEFDKAITFFKNAGAFKDATTKLSEIAYAQAEEALKTNDNQTAAKYFADAGNYKDALDRAHSIYYNLGAASSKKKLFDDAIEYFTNAGDYKDSKSQVQIARYNKAKVLISKKQYEDAAKELTNVGDYAAAKKLFDTTITALITSKDYDNAEKMAEYSDPITMNTLKNYISGRRSFNTGDYISALMAFEKAEGVKDSALFINASNYSLGLNAIKDKDFGLAESYFSKSGNYKNSNVLNNVCKAEIAISAEKWSNAVYYYNRVPKTLKVNGINIQSRKAFMNRIAAFEKIKGEYSARSNKVATTNVWRENKKYKYTWSITKILDQHEMSLDYSVNSDGTINLSGNVTYVHCTNYSSLSSLLETKVDTSYFELKNLKSIPANAVIDNHLRLKFKKGMFAVVYYERDNYSQYFYNIYQTTINFKKDS